MRMRTRYLPIENAIESMVLGDAARDGYQRSLLPSGATLTDENLQQLAAHHVEYLCVTYEETRTDEEIAVDVAATALRVLAIFEQADFSDPVTAALFNQVLTYRSA